MLIPFIHTRIGLQVFSTYFKSKPEHKNCVPPTQVNPAQHKLHLDKELENPLG